MTKLSKELPINKSTTDPELNISLKLKGNDITKLLECKYNLKLDNNSDVLKKALTLLYFCSEQEKNGCSIFYRDNGEIFQVRI